MRFISKYSNYGVSILKPEYEIVATEAGRKLIPVTDGFIALFDHGGLKEYEISEAMKYFEFRGTAEGENPMRRLSVFDTDVAARVYNWSDKMKELVENKLLERAGASFIRIEKPPAEKPWPNYDRIRSVEKILAKVKEDGYDPKLVLEYEMENLNRDNLVDALRELIVESTPEEPQPTQIEVVV